MGDLMIMGDCSASLRGRPRPRFVKAEPSSSLAEVEVIFEKSNFSPLLLEDLRGRPRVFVAEVEMVREGTEVVNAGSLRDPCLRFPDISSTPSHSESELDATFVKSNISTPLLSASAIRVPDFDKVLPFFCFLVGVVVGVILAFSFADGPLFFDGVLTSLSELDAILMKLNCSHSLLLALADLRGRPLCCDLALAGSKPPSELDTMWLKSNSSPSLLPSLLPLVEDLGRDLDRALVIFVLPIVFEVDLDFRRFDVEGEALVIFFVPLGDFAAAFFVFFGVTRSSSSSDTNMSSGSATTPRVFPSADCSRR